MKSTHYCNKCGNEIIYDRKLSSYTKTVNDIIYVLCTCESCLIEKFPEYVNKNKTRIFNTCNEITCYAFNIPEEEKNLSNKKKAPTEKHLIEKYGIAEGHKKWEEYRISLSNKNTLAFYIERYGEEIGKEKYVKHARSRSCTAENFKRRHGVEEGEKKWEQYKHRQAYTETLEYCIEKYGKLEGYKKYQDRCKKKIVSLKTMQKKYGEEEGRKKYESCINKRLETLSKSPGFSKKATYFFEELIKMLPEELNKEIKYSGNREQHFSVESKFYVVDFYIPSIRLIIEFFGDYWHANPQIYSEHDIMFEGKEAKEIWKRDKKRIDNLKTTGNDVLVVWEQNVTESINNIHKEIIKRWNIK